MKKPLYSLRSNDIGLISEMFNSSGREVETYVNVTCMDFSNNGGHFLGEADDILVSRTNASCHLRRHTTTPSQLRFIIRAFQIFVPFRFRFAKRVFSFM
jgi:hypothetical protein